MTDYLQVHGLTPKHKKFLKSYALKNLGTSVMTKAILHLIEQAMLDDNSEVCIDDELRCFYIKNKQKHIEKHQQKLRNREHEINKALLEKDHELLTKLYRKKVTLKKERIQLSLPIYDYEFLEKLADNSNSSIQYYIIVLLNHHLYNQRKLLGNEIEQLKKSNYELYKIGVNVNQIAKANNAGDMVELPINQLYELIEEHINIVKLLLNNSVDIY